LFFATKDSYFVLDVGPDAPIETETSRGGGVLDSEVATRKMQAQCLQKAVSFAKGGLLTTVGHLSLSCALLA